MTELRGKGWCVLGYLLWMLGAGIFLDAGPWWTARVLCAAGASLFAVGWLQLRRAGARRADSVPQGAEAQVAGASAPCGRTS